MALDLPHSGDVTWAVTLRVDGSRMPLSSPRAHIPLRTASVGKVLLLLAIARRVADREIAVDEPLKRTPEDWVQDSGLWHTFSSETLPLSDVAALVGAVSDNLATNVLLRRIGLEAVASATASLGLMRTALQDRVRATRGPSDPSTLSVGTTLELSWLAGRVMRGTAMGAEADRLVREWLSGNVDQSMVGSAFVDRFGLDPIAHHASLGGDLEFWNKTGTDAGVRAEIGAATLGGRTVAWAAVANWEPELDAKLSGEALSGMRRIGASVLRALS
jgi:beta-lactamase class A